ncbi:MAG: tetratricopeptide repeat protein [Desulfobacterales bacterium]|nr:tetratricopeptide repeat protein [Desulfobacterales bacterium]
MTKRKTKKNNPVKKQDKPNVEKNRKHISIYVLSAILLLTLAIFSNSLNNDFIINWDDYEYIINNNHIKSLSIRNIKIFLSDYFVANYQPLTMLSYALEYKFFGLNPKPFHITNLLLHLLNIVLLFRFIYLLTEKTETAAIVALFFAVHPMHVESVSWISERKDVLYSFFFLGSLITYLYYVKNNRNYKYCIISLLLFFFSLLSKSAAVTLPVILVLTDYYIEGNFAKKNIPEKIPFFILSIIFGIIAVFSQKSTGATDIAPFFPLYDRIFLVSYALLFYIFKMFAPFNLSALYFYPDKTNNLLPYGYYIAPVVVILISWVICKAAKFRKDMVFGVLFFLINILPVIQIIPVGRAFAADRYTYIPFIGLFFIIGQFFSRITDRKTYPSPKAGNIFIIILLCYTIFFSIATWNRNNVWKNSVILWSDVIEKNPSKDQAYFARGLAKMRSRDFQGAVEDYNKAADLNPESAGTYYSRGLVKFYMKNFQEAIRDYNRAIVLKPNYKDAYYNRGVAKYYLKDFQGAVEDYSKVTELNPKDAQVYFNLGAVKMQMKMKKEACEDWHKSFKSGYVQAGEMIKKYCQ